MSPATRDKNEVGGDLKGMTARWNDLVLASILAVLLRQGKLKIRIMLIAFSQYRWPPIEEDPVWTIYCAVDADLQFPNHPVRTF